MDYYELELDNIQIFIGLSNNHIVECVIRPYGKKMKTLTITKSINALTKLRKLSIMYVDKLIFDNGITYLHNVFLQYIDRIEFRCKVDIYKLQLRYVDNLHFRNKINIIKLSIFNVKNIKGAKYLGKVINIDYDVDYYRVYEEVVSAYEFYYSSEVENFYKYGRNEIYNKLIENNKNQIVKLLTHSKILKVFTVNRIMLQDEDIAKLMKDRNLV